MLEIINKYRALSFKEKTIFTTKFSILINFLLGVGKAILSFFFGIFFLVAGIVNFFIMLTKLECYLGVKYPNKKTFDYRNKCVGIFLLIAGLEYAIYMCRMIFTDVAIMSYGMILGIIIACVAFVELAIAIKGCFNSLGKGHYYRNIKLTSLCSALTAIVLTEVALTSFASKSDLRVVNGLVGMIVGVIMVLISIYIFVSPKISIVDREHNVYKLKENLESIKDEGVKIKLTNSKFYRDYVYVGKVDGDIIDGHIVQEKSPIWSWNIYWLSLVILLSEILIFPYAVGALIFHFKCRNIITDLDNKMLETIIKKFAGGPVGVETLASAIGEDIDTIEDVYEPYLMQIGFLNRTPRGRVATPSAYEHMKVAFPDKGGCTSQVKMF